MAATKDQVLADLGALPSAEQAEVRQALGLRSPRGAAFGNVWLILIGGLVAGGVLAGSAAFLLFMNDKSDDATAFVAIATTIVGALIGLIAPSPLDASR
jgi:hypothetical protein